MMSVPVTAATEHGQAVSELPFPATWLRDNCSRPDCRDPLSGQKFFQITDLPDGLWVASVEESGETITVTFAPEAR